MQASGTLTRKQEALISALLTAPRLTDAVHQVGISEVTAWRWLKDTAFQAAYKAARRAVVEQAIVQVQQYTGDAVTTLREVMQDASASASARVSAAKAMLDTAFKVVELEDLEQRIADLEAHLAGPSL